MDPEEEQEKADKQMEIKKSINILIKAINDKPNNIEAIQEIINSIKITFKPETILQINSGLYDTEDSKIINKKNLEYVLKKLQSAQILRRNEEAIDEEEISGGKRKRSIKKRRRYTKKRIQKKRKQTKKRRF
jgi:hypothetical protein